LGLGYYGYSSYYSDPCVVWDGTHGSTPATKTARNRAATRHDPPVHPGGFCIEPFLQRGWGTT
jgi:hypothetical protein